MPAIIRYPFRSDNAFEYFKRYGDPASTENMYIAVGRTTPWANETTPPTPLDSENDEIQTWNNMIGAKLVQKNDIVMVVPRIDWVSGTEYFVVDPALEDPFVNPCYVLNSQNQVFLCVGKPGAGVQSTVEPIFTPTANSARPVDITTADGYTWRFLYDIPFYDAANLMNSVWMPCMAGHKITTNQNQYGYPWAYSILHCRWVMFRTRFLDTDLPINISYRQISLVHNPWLAGSNTLATGALYSQTTAGGNTTPPQAWNNAHINIHYTENHQPIYRASGQFEEIKIVLEF